jgi:stage V sporulation protein B
MSKTQKNFVAGAAILGIIGVLVKIIGAVFRIPLANMITEDGMAYYQAAYPMYVFLLAIASAGMPVAISKMVSERVALNDYRGANRVFRKAFRALLMIGLAATVLMLLLSNTVANIINIPNSKFAFLAIAPSLFFVAAISAYRGYFQGLQMMAPTAFSQLIEQVGKLGLGLFFAYLWKDQGLYYGAAGAMLGVTLSEVLALIFMIVMYNLRKADIKLQIKKTAAMRSHFKDTGIGKRLFILAMPIIIGACAMPLVQMADTAIVTNSLVSVGFEPEHAKGLFGLLTGFVNPLINMPAVLSLALAMSLVPAISSSLANKDMTGTAKKSGMGFKLAMLVGFPCAAGFFLLAQPIMHLLYSSLSGDSLKTAGTLLTIMAVGVLFLTILQTLTGILQGLGKTYIPVINLFIGVAVKVAVSLIYIRMPEVNIKGAAIGTVACYAIAALLDIFFVIKYARFKFRFIEYIFKPVLAVGVMGLFAYFAIPYFSTLISESMATVLTIAASGIIYILLLFVFGALKKDDMEFIPGGSRIIRFMNKIGLWSR